MTGRDTARRWWVGVVLGGTILLPIVYSCTEDERLAAPSPAGALRADGQAGNPFGPPFSVPIPASNEAAVAPVMTQIVIPPGVQAQITITGTMTFIESPGVTLPGACPPPLPAPISPGNLTTVGPAGFLAVNDPRFSGGYRGGEVEVYESDDSHPPPNGIRLQYFPRDPAAGTVTGVLSGFPNLGHIWVMRPPSFPGSCGINGGTPNASSIPDYTVTGNQTLSADFAVPGGGGGCSTPPCPVSVTVVATARGSTGSLSVETPNGSFTGKSTDPAEDVLKLHGTVTPAAFAPRVRWQVTADPSHFPFPVLQPPPTAGPDAAFTVIPLLPGRWPVSHLQSLALAPKQLSYVFTASVQDDQGQTHTSSPVTVTQNDTDTVREEYVEFALSDPDTYDIPTPESFVENVDGAGHFGPADLNGGDYRNPQQLYWAQGIMLDGLDAIWSLVQQRLPDFTGLALESVFRNPVHHVFHTLPPKQLWNNSAHQYGLAADIVIDNQSVPSATFFHMLELAAHDWRVGACFEPAATIKHDSRHGTLTHAHVDWMPPACAPGW